jgi:histidine triad (HIT) family protein
VAEVLEQKCVEWLMSDQCVFCRIVNNEESRSAIYEDDKVVAIMDFRPVNEGHTLVIPKKHYENIYEIPEEEVAYLFKIVKKLAGAVRLGVNAEGISLVQNNGKAASQVVFHLHVHIIPRYEGKKSSRPREVVGANVLEKVADRIRGVL